MKQQLVPKENRGIPDINKIRAQYEAGFSIRQLSIYWEIPYATLYREINNKGRKQKNEKNLSK